MPLFVARNLSKAFGDRVLFDGVDISIHAGDRVGVVGDNGSGKSTLARILIGDEPSDTGEVAFRRGIVARYLRQVPNLDVTLSARETVQVGLRGWHEAVKQHRELSAQIEDQAPGWHDAIDAQQRAASRVEALGGWEQEHRVSAMLERLGVGDPERLVANLSGGEQRRVALAQLLVEQPDLAILDEPTNHLDAQTIEWLEVYLADHYQGALMLITHDRYVLDRVANRTVEVNNGRVHQYEGGWSRYLEEREARIALAGRTEANRQNLLRTEIDWLRRSPKARTTKSKARVQRVEELRDQPVDRLEARVATLQIQSERLGSTVLEAKRAWIESAGGDPLINDFSLVLTKGQRVGIIGRNGVGKTTLLRTLMGEVEPAKGSIRIGGTVSFAYFDQGRTGLDDAKTVRENVAGERLKVEFAGKTVDIRSYLARFMFERHRVNEKVGVLSGGERARVALAKLLLSPANVLVLDEPTNDLDVATLSALEDMLVEADVTALVVSHDRYFLDRVTNTILAFEGENELVEYAGDFTTFVATQRERESQKRTAARESVAAPVVAPTRSNVNEPVVDRTVRKLTYKEQKELRAIELKIEKAEAKLGELEAQLADGSFYTAQPGAVEGVVKQRDDLRASLDELLQRWGLLAAIETNA